MPLSLTVSCVSKIQIGFTFLVPAHLGSPGQRAVKQVCVDQTVSLKLDPKPVSVLTNGSRSENHQASREQTWT